MKLFITALQSVKKGGAFVFYVQAHTNINVFYWFASIQDTLEQF